MIGRLIVDWDQRIADCEDGATRAASSQPVDRCCSRLTTPLFSNPQSAGPNPQSRGFTLLELMIVISIIVILAVIAMPQYQRAVIHAKETVLRDDLFQMRKMIDQYAADKGKLPGDLSELVDAGYMREIPKDPMTDKADWVPVPGDDPASLEGGQGIIDVRSASTEQSTEGNPYNEW